MAITQGKNSGTKAKSRYSKTIWNLCIPTPNKSILKMTLWKMLYCWTEKQRGDGDKSTTDMGAVVPSHSFSLIVLRAGSLQVVGFFICQSWRIAEAQSAVVDCLVPLVHHLKTLPWLMGLPTCLNSPSQEKYSFTMVLHSSLSGSNFHHQNDILNSWLLILSHSWPNNLRRLFVSP